MNIREALQQQTPSLALQRAAADEIAKLDSLLVQHMKMNVANLDRVQIIANAISNFRSHLPVDAEIGGSALGPIKALLTALRSAVEVDQ